jgi:Ca-activated chloride channel family protein
LSFEAPVLLLFLLAIPAAVAGYAWLERHRADRAAAWTTPALVPNLVPRDPGWRRHVPVALLLVGVTLLLVGFARPKATITVKRHEATVVLVLDISGSMAANDVQPSRLAAARAAAARLVATVPKTYRIAVITFSDHAALVAPPTLDRTIVLAALKRARTGPQGTALTAAVSRAVTIATSVPGSGPHLSPPSVVLVFSDGGQTARGPTTQQAGQQAAKAHVPVSAVAVGTANGVVHQKITGGYTEQIAVPVESTTLRTIAQASGGHVVTTLDTAFLDHVVADLGSRVGHERKGIEVTSAAAGGGMALMLVGAFLGGVWFRRVP